MELKINVKCCLCGEKIVVVATMPDGWGFRYGAETDIEDAFCPAHKSIEEWCGNVCPGCVGGWGDCSFWHSFAYSQWDFSTMDFRMIKDGVCPKRTNGTMAATRSERDVKIESIDISSKAPEGPGELLVKAILEYWNKYHPEDKKNEMAHTIIAEEGK